MTSFERFMCLFREKLYADNALQHVDTLAAELFKAYQLTHLPGHLIDRLSMTEAANWVCASQNWSGFSDSELWEGVTDTLSDLELLELMCAWVPNVGEEKA